MKEKFLGIYFIILSLTIYILYFLGFLNNFLANKVIIFSLLSGVLLLIIGILLVCNKFSNIKIEKNTMLLVIPIIMIIIAGDGKLGLEFSKKRGSNLSTLNSINNYNYNYEEEDANNESDKVYEINDKNYVRTINYLNSNMDKVIGSRIKISGFTIKDASYITDGYFVIGKYIITCCVADAGIIGILVKQDDLKTVNDSSWYEIEGTITSIEDKFGQRAIAITSDKITSVDNEEMYVYGS